MLAREELSGSGQRRGALGGDARAAGPRVRAANYEDVLPLLAVGPTHRTRSGAGVGHHVAERLTTEVAAEIVGEEVEDRFDVMVERRRRMWRQAHVRRVPQRAVGRQRLLTRDVQHGGPEVTGPERVEERGLVDERP